MRAINTLLCFVVSALIAVVVFEVGLRVLGKGPQTTINRFDPNTGWSLTPGSSGERSTGEFHVRYDVNELGLRDDPMSSPAKPAGTFRVLVLGDSFVQGYTVDRRDLFVDLLENWWQAEGRKVDVVNVGTEGWSTDQEVAWFEKNGAAFQPDVVVICPYENDIYWSGQTHYRRFPKPRYTPFGDREQGVLQDPGAKPWYEHTAIGNTWSLWREPTVRWQPVEGRSLEMEHAAYFKTPPSFLVDAIARVRGALTALRHHCTSVGAKLVMVPIPNKAAIEAGARATLERSLRVPTDTWSPDQPVDTFVGLAQELGIEVFDPRPGLRAAAAEGKPLYYQRDWHFDPHGNHVFASLLHDEFERAGLFPATVAKTVSATMPLEPEPSRVPRWAFWFGGLWIALSCLYASTYRDEPWWKAVLGVGGMLGAVFAIAIGGGALLSLVPPQIATAILIVAVAALLSFIVYKLGARLSTITELFGAFTRRGHWYLMPLVVVLLTVGSLLVVAASSPLIAPFIYTLF